MMLTKLEFAVRLFVGGFFLGVFLRMAIRESFRKD